MQTETTQLSRLGVFERPLRNVAVAAAICAVLLFICVTFIDRPVMRYAAQHQRFDDLYELMAAPSLLSLPFAFIYLVIYASRVIAGRPQSAYTSLFLTLSVAIVTANAAKDELKYVIGRPWPFEWLKYGVYHIQPFTDSAFFGSLPSGHTTYISAPMFVLWWRLPPRYRPIWMAIIASVMIGLVGYGFHFVGDVVAGFFVGMAAAAAAVAVIPETPLPHPALRRRR